VFDSRVQKKIFVLKRDEVTAEWRILHNLELYGSVILKEILFG
jgi:hypothetical protein